MKNFRLKNWKWKKKQKLATFAISKHVSNNFLPQTLSAASSLFIYSCVFDKTSVQHVTKMKFLLDYICCAQTSSRSWLELHVRQQKSYHATEWLLNNSTFYLWELPGNVPNRTRSFQIKVFHYEFKKCFKTFLLSLKYDFPTAGWLAGGKSPTSSFDCEQYFCCS